MRGFEGSVSNSLYLKNENVQKYLCIPDRIWQKLQYLSANSELFYLCSNTDINVSEKNRNYLRLGKIILRQVKYCIILGYGLRYHQYLFSEVL